ncbi:hypothetical protein WA026_012921 [Henosepilachna vigintioctopunctata]|uniref:Uncharacterized protein n=1 Tax=Henosepilachna vigintioctopunctata TaxID=420089 RepID=A0AAW1TWK8_9CUCU
MILHYSELKVFYFELGIVYSALSLPSSGPNSSTKTKRVKCGKFRKNVFAIQIITMNYLNICTNCSNHLIDHRLKPQITGKKICMKENISLNGLSFINHKTCI